jgi:DNA-binding NarL/FixJ family response regulator
MSINVKIVVTEPSAIIRRGVCSMLNVLKNISIDIFEADDFEQLKNFLVRQKPNIVIVNNSFIGNFALAHIKKNFFTPNTKCVALQTNLCENSTLKEYDETISIYDTETAIKQKISALIHKPEQDKRHELLSSREKEIILQIIKGLTNKQIADKLCLSVHTVITHRRNIASKLQIHSTAGLTIYAISNKLVEVKD